MKVAVIADDLTGAADSGVQLARAGYRTAVAFRGSPVPPAEDLDAVAVDTDSRAMSAESAAKLVVEAGQSVRGARVVFKKVDSTLRGPVAAELSAALEATGRRVAVVCPAFPDAGRTVSGGVLLVNGVPVHETGFRDDPVTPVRKSYLPALLSAVSAGCSRSWRAQTASSLTPGRTQSWRHWCEQCRILRQCCGWARRGSSGRSG